MSRTKYGAAATYSLPKVKMIIEDQCQKKHLVLKCPNLEKGLLNKKAREYGPVNPYEELFSMINNCITELEAFRDKLEDFVIFGG